MSKVIITVIGLIIFARCLKEERPIQPKEPGNVHTQTLTMGADYKWQVYFDLGKNQEVGRHPKTDWDLGFTCCDTAHNIVINSSKMMYALHTDQFNFNAVTDTAGFTANKKRDMPSGNLDSTALYGWKKNEVFIIDRGYAPDGSHLGMRKLQLNNANMDEFTITFGLLQSNEGTTITIPRNVDYNYTHFNLETGGIADIAPPKDDWDLIFTQYTHLFYEPEETPYLVTGCLLNDSKTRALQLEESIDFEDIDIEYASEILLEEKRNVLGYNWKTFTGNGYEVDGDQLFIIRDREGFFYKLRFIDFYDEEGNKGTPTFEFQQL